MTTPTIILNDVGLSLVDISSCKRALTLFRIFSEIIIEVICIQQPRNYKAIPLGTSISVNNEIVMTTDVAKLPQSQLRDCSACIGSGSAWE